MRSSLKGRKEAEQDGDGEQEMAKKASAGVERSRREKKKRSHRGEKSKRVNEGGRGRRGPRARPRTPSGKRKKSPNSSSWGSLEPSLDGIEKEVGKDKYAIRRPEKPPHCTNTRASIEKTSPTKR